VVDSGTGGPCPAGRCASSGFRRRTRPPAGSTHLEHLRRQLTGIVSPRPAHPPGRPPAAEGSYEASSTVHLPAKAPSGIKRTALPQMSLGTASGFALPLTSAPITPQSNHPFVPSVSASLPQPCG
jgi:hypothetical protein